MRCSPISAVRQQGWSEAQAARQVLAALNQQLFRRQRSGQRIPQLNAGLLLLQAGDAHFLQAGAIGLLRDQDGVLHSLVGRDGLQLGAQAELALVQHRLPLSPGQVLLLAPQPLLAVGDLQGFRDGCVALSGEGLPALLAPWLGAPGAAMCLLSGAVDNSAPATVREQWPAVPATVGMRLDGWTLLEACPYGPPGRLYRAREDGGREGLLWLAEQAADEAFWQREWALRRSPVVSLPQVLSPHQPRRHAFLLLEAPPADVQSLSDWTAAHGSPEATALLVLLDQLIAAVRALQRRGMQGLWLDPRCILVNPQGQLLLLPEQAALLPGVPRQRLPVEAIPLAPELRGSGAVDGRADQFALAALVYWLLGGRWPEVACAGTGESTRYVPLASFMAGLPAGWDGVLARALAPQPAARFTALSEWRQALHQPLGLKPVARAQAPRQAWRLALVGALLLQVGLGLWFSLLGGP